MIRRNSSSYFSTPVIRAILRFGPEEKIIMHSVQIENLTNNPTVQQRKAHYHDYWTHIDHFHPLKPLYPKHEFLLESELKMLNF